MKLSHRDFRPPRRSKYVTQPPKRRPTLRILLLGLIGLAVYLKFDAVARLPFWDTVKHPRAWLDAHLHAGAAAPAPPAPVALRLSGDSLSAEAECPSAAAVCLTAGFPLGAEAAGSLREVLAKAEAQLGADAGTGFLATFARGKDAAAGDTAWSPVRIELRGARPMILDRKGPAWCAAGKCLDETRPQAPLAAFRAVAAHALALPRAVDPGLEALEWPEARFAAQADAPVRPVLRGRVVDLPAPGDSADWIKLHHGRNLFSYYRGLARIDSAVRVGAMVEPGATLGWTAPESAAVDLRVEADGRPLDPLAFLGLNAETAHAR